jgi:hypothetical protein
MGFLEDPLSGEALSRNELEEEEEAAIANDLPKQYKVKPVVEVRDHDVELPMYLLRTKHARSHVLNFLINFLRLCSLKQRVVPLAH